MSDKKTFEELRLTGFELTALEWKEEEKEDEELKRKKRFSGVAYTGDVIPRHGFTKNLIIDLDSVDFQAQIPIFKNHNPDQIVGFGRVSSDGRRINVEGEILDTPSGQEVSDLNDAGFRWELSVGVSAEKVLIMGEDDEREVNGQLLSGEHVILKNPRITETSFVPIGADRNTSVSVFSRLFGKKTPTFDAEVINKEPQGSEGVEDMEKMKELEAKVVALSEKVKEYELKEEKAKVESKIEGVELSEDVKELVIEAYISGDELAAKLADHIIDQKAEVEEKEELEAELAKEEKTIEEAEKKVNAELEAKADALPKELFKAEKIDEGTANIALSGKSLKDMAKDLQKKHPEMDFTTAVFEAKKLKSGV